MSATSNHTKYHSISKMTILHTYCYETFNPLLQTQTTLNFTPLQNWETKIQQGS